MTRRPRRRRPIRNLGLRGSALFLLACLLLVLPVTAWSKTGSGDEPTDSSSETEKTAVGETEKLEEAKAASQKKVDTAEPFRPAPPIRGQFDWIRLKSGEWLKGRIELLRDESLNFDSDELDDLTFDWLDVREVRSPHLNTYVFEGRRVVVGRAAIDEDWVVISVKREAGSGIGKGEAEQEMEAPGERQYERKKLIAIIKGERKELNYWSGKVSLGIQQRSGNTDQIDFTGYALIHREDQFSRITLSYSSAIGTVNGETNTNNHRGNAGLDIFFNRRLFWTAAAMEVFHDQFQNIAIRLIPTTGLGYQVIDRAKLTWSFSLGAGYRYTEFFSVPTSLAKDQQSGVMVGTMKFDWDLTQRVDVDASYTVQMGVPQADRTDHHALVMFSIDITKYLDVDLSWGWDHIGQPAPDSSGVFPKKDDFRSTVGLGVDF